MKFKHFMSTDKVDFLRTKPAYPMYYDTNFNYARDRDYWGKVLIGMAVGTYAYNKF